jgi:Cache domain/GAF domain
LYDIIKNTMKILPKSQLSIRHQIVLLTCLGMVLVTLVAMIVSVVAIQNKGERELAAYEKELLQSSKNQIVILVDLGHDLLDGIYQKSQLISGVDSLGRSVEAQQYLLLKKGLEQLRNFRFDNGEGYFTVTDNKLPYPVMLMHATKPALEGTVLDSDKYKMVKGTNEHMYQKRVKDCLKSGDSFVEYLWSKPGEDELMPKLSYSRYHKGLKCIISTGIYIDQIEKAVAHKEEILGQKTNQIIIQTIVYSIFCLILVIIIALLYSKKLIKAIDEIKNSILELSQGKRVNMLELNRKDEIGEIAHSLNGLIKVREKHLHFADEIGKGNLQVSVELLDQEDTLGNSLMYMRNELLQSAKEYEQRNWANEGHSQLLHVLREDRENQAFFYDQILLFLANYMKASHASLMIVEEDQNEKYLELKSCMAYHRHRFLRKKMYLEEGLVGRCISEKSMIYLTEIPQDYIKVTSGIGEPLPTNLILLPLFDDGKDIGVLEMGFFDKLAPFEIDFLEAAAKTVAALIASIKINEETKKLLEVSQIQAEELRAQEEEMRQNNEELMATQEEMRRKSAELEELLGNRQMIEQELLEINLRYKELENKLSQNQS